MGKMQKTLQFIGFAAMTGCGNSPQPAAPKEVVATAVVLSAEQKKCLDTALDKAIVEDAAEAARKKLAAASTPGASIDPQPLAAAQAVYEKAAADCQLNADLLKLYAERTNVPGGVLPDSVETEAAKTGDRVIVPETRRIGRVKEAFANGQVHLTWVDSLTDAMVTTQQISVAVKRRKGFVEGIRVVAPEIRRLGEVREVFANGLVWLVWEDSGTSALVSAEQISPEIPMLPNGLKHGSIALSTPTNQVGKVWHVFANGLVSLTLEGSQGGALVESRLLSPQAN